MDTTVTIGGIHVKPPLAAEAVQTMTLEAFADTIVPGEKRFPGDRAIAGIAEGGGAVAAGAVDLMRTEAGGMADALPNLVQALNKHAEAYRDELRLEADPEVPAFVALPAGHRAMLVAGHAKVVVLERGPWLTAEEFDHDFRFGASGTRIFDFVIGNGMSLLGGNCVGGGSVVYFAAMPRAPRFVFERRGSIGRRMWPK